MLRVFCDFDGTVAKLDIGNELFSHFAGPVAHVIAQRYVNGEITARECLRSEAEAAGNVSAEAVSSFVKQFDVDEHFREFKDFCSKNAIPLTILSDGLDFYLEQMLRTNELEDCGFRANHLEFVRSDAGTRMSISFPHTDSECLECGNCKRNHILTLSGDDDLIVYVGDGISDRCPVHFADIVFAKKGLIKYCQDANISYFEYATFRDVRLRLETVLEKKRLRKRREAEMARRDVFMQG